MIKWLIKENQTKENLVQTIYLNQEILSDIEKTRIAYEQIFWWTELKHYKRLNRWSESHKAVIDECIIQIMQILEEEEKLLLDIN